jgi:hypothetical protein
MAIEITERRRRLVIDWVLVGVIVACCTAFFDLRATVHAQTKAFDQLSHRIERSRLTRRPHHRTRPRKATSRDWKDGSTSWSI